MATSQQWLKGLNLDEAGLSCLEEDDLFEDLDATKTNEEVKEGEMGFSSELVEGNAIEEAPAKSLERTEISEEPPAKGVEKEGVSDTAPPELEMATENEVKEDLEVPDLSVKEEHKAETVEETSKEEHQQQELARAKEELEALREKARALEETARAQEALLEAEKSRREEAERERLTAMKEKQNLGSLLHEIQMENERQMLQEQHRKLEEARREESRRNRLQTEAFPFDPLGLDRAFTLTTEQISNFRKKGYVLLSNPFTASCKLSVAKCIYGSTNTSAYKAPEPMPSSLSGAGSLNEVSKQKGKEAEVTEGKKEEEEAKEDAEEEEEEEEQKPSKKKKSNNNNNNKRKRNTRQASGASTQKSKKSKKEAETHNSEAQQQKSHTRYDVANGKRSAEMEDGSVVFEDDSQEGYSSSLDMDSTRPPEPQNEVLSEEELKERERQKQEEEDAKYADYLLHQTADRCRALPRTLIGGEIRHQPVFFQYPILNLYKSGTLYAASRDLLLKDTSEEKNDNIEVQMSQFPSVLIDPGKAKEVSFEVSMNEALESRAVGQFQCSLYSEIVRRSPQELTKFPEERTGHRELDSIGRAPPQEVVFVIPVGCKESSPLTIEVVEGHDGFVPEMSFLMRGSFGASKGVVEHLMAGEDEMLLLDTFLTNICLATRWLMRNKQSKTFEWKEIKLTGSPELQECVKVYMDKPENGERCQHVFKLAHELLKERSHLKSLGLQSPSRFSILKTTTLVVEHSHMLAISPYIFKNLSPEDSCNSSFRLPSFSVCLPYTLSHQARSSRFSRELANLGVADPTRLNPVNNPIHGLHNNNNNNNNQNNNNNHNNMVVAAPPGNATVHRTEPGIGINTWVNTTNGTISVSIMANGFGTMITTSSPIGVSNSSISSTGTTSHNNTQASSLGAQNRVYGLRKLLRETGLKCIHLSSPIFCPCEDKTNHPSYGCVFDSRKARNFMTFPVGEFKTKVCPITVETSGNAPSTERIRINENSHNTCIQSACALAHNELTGHPISAALLGKPTLLGRPEAFEKIFKTPQMMSYASMVFRAMDQADALDSLRLSSITPNLAAFNIV